MARQRTRHFWKELPTSAELARDVDAWLAEGNTIKVIPMGVSAEKPQGWKLAAKRSKGQVAP